MAITASNNWNSLRFALKNLLESRGLTQAELAARAHINASHLSRYIRGETVPTIDQLSRFAEALGVSPAYLIASPDERIKLGMNIDSNVTLPDDFITGVANAVAAKLAESKQAQPRQSHAHPASRPASIERLVVQLEQIPEPLLHSLERIFSKMIAARLDEYQKKSGDGK